MIGLRDRLAHLNYRQACKLLGPKGPKLIREGGRMDIDPALQVDLGLDILTLKLNGLKAHIRLDDRKPGHLAFACSRCRGVCEHVGAAFSLVLEEKLSLGLATAPEEKPSGESLSVSDQYLIEKALEERRERVRKEKMRIAPSEPGKLWADYVVTNPASGKTFRVALRGERPGESFCGCPDFRINTLGTCKHILAVLEKMRRRIPRSLWKPFVHRKVTVYLHYGEKLALHLALPEKTEGRIRALLAPLTKGPITDVTHLLERIRKAEASGTEILIYPDAEEHIQRDLYALRMERMIAEIRRDPAGHPLRKSLLKTELLPYQMDGIAFAVGAGRAVLADEMGLGKTIQGIGAAERADQYGNACFFTICNYEQVIRDILAVERHKWDYIILDEGQRIKNWEAKTSRIVKGLRSRFALVLSGTPMENRLEELFSVVQFIDAQRLGPAFRFFHRHRLTDDKGKVLKYQNLGDLRERLKPILLRRTRNQVLRELPPRTNEIRRIPATVEQQEMHDGNKRIVSTILSKKFLTEMDLMRLQKHLLLCRMASDSTTLVDKEKPGYSSKLKELNAILDQLSAEKDKKILLFSEWTTMLDLIEPILKKLRMPFVRLDGQVPQKKRQALVREFQENPDCRLFITTNAGSTGLNLQAANTVINVDLPWNPAVLEQRIARAHRMGQKRPVHVILLVTEGTIEEGLLGTLSAKKLLALAALDPETQVDAVDFHSGIEELKGRLEILLGEKPAEPVQERIKSEAEAEAARLGRKEALSQAGGQLLIHAFAFMGELLSRKNHAPETDSLAGEVRERLTECLEQDEKGDLKLVLSLPGATTLDSMANVFANMMRLSDPS